MNMASYLKKTNGEKGQDGFSIIEVAVAVAIIAISFVTLSSLFNYNLRMEILSRNKTIAAYLAQEAVEVVRAARDDNWFLNNEDGWLGSSDNSPFSNWTYIPVGTSNNIIVYDSVSKHWNIRNVGSSTDDRTRVYLVPSARYMQSDTGVPAGGQETIFRRWVDFESVNDHTLRITVHVNYGTSQTLNIVSYLYNGWY